MTRRVRVIHWKPEEIVRECSGLRAAGFLVDAESFTGPSSVRAMRSAPPDAFVIDLNRLPMQGRDVAVAFRRHRETRGAPIVFVGGQPEKVAKIAATLPDAVFSQWVTVLRDLRQVLKDPPEDPAVPDSIFAGYAGTPLLQKFGVVRGTRVALVNAPEHFDRVLGTLPPGAELRRGRRARADVYLWFVRTEAQLRGEAGHIVGAAGRAPVWMIWPKKASSLGSDLTQSIVRKIGLAAGLVDYKVCRVDDVWAGLKFTARKP